MKKNIFIYIFFFVFAFGQVHAQQKGKVQNVTVESVVKDENGNPLEGALIYGKEGAVIVKTDENGKFSITVPSASRLLVESKAYNSVVVSQNDLSSEIKLEKSAFLRGENDDVKIAFGTIKKADLTGIVSVVEPDEYIEFDNSQNVGDALAGRITGLFGAGNIHGLGNAMVVVDGIPRYSSLSQVNINMEEIDQISVLKDVSATALYGSQARNGVIIITTKRGKAMKRDINVTASYGIAKPKALPKYLGSADYMELYNEARTNDGLAALYDATTIENFRSGNPYRYPSVDYFSGDYLKSAKNYSNVLTEFSGGNQNTVYYANLGWARQGSLIDFGNAVGANSNRLNLRANVDVKINDFIKSNLDIAGIYEFSKGPVGNYWSDASTLRPYLFSPLLPMSLLQKNNAAINNILTSKRNDVDGMYLLGGTQQNTTTPFAAIYAGGTTGQINRTMQLNNGVDVDLNHLVEGLTLRTNFSFDFYNSYNQSISNTYSIYAPTWSATEDSIVGLTQYGTDTRPGTQSVSGDDFFRRIGIFAQFDYNRSFGDHNVSGTLLGFLNTIKTNGIIQPDKNTHVGLRVLYNYKEKYFLNFSSAYVNSVKLGPGSKGDLAPTIALAWDLSKESFLEDAKNIDYLKLRASAGTLISDMSLAGYYFYDGVLLQGWEGGNYSYDDGGAYTYATYSTFGANPNLSYEKRKEINLGLEGEFFKHRLHVDANYFNTLISGKYTQRESAYPSFYSTSSASYIPWENYDQDRYSGVELGLSYNQKVRSFSYQVGANLMYWDSKVVKKDELYANDYQYRQGRPTDAFFALESEGLFQDANDIKNHAFQTFGEVRPGDIKYKDQNDDGIIDANDQVQIGRWNAPLTYGLNFLVSYKNLSLFAVGNGNFGSDAYLSGDYYWVDGDKKYSEKVLDRWTEATKNTATYPRLSSKSNTNNHRASTFWAYKNNYFTINRVQITYDMPESLSQKVAMKKLSIYVSGSGLATISKQNDVRNLNFGREPQYRYFSLGVRTMF